MSVLFRTRVASFLSGVAVSGVYAIYQLRKDLTESHELLLKQVNDHANALDGRLSRLESVVASMQNT